MMASACRLPGVISPKTVVRTPVSLLDLAPTILDFLIGSVVSLYV